ncbi:hypothetical protein ABPG74_021175 [Tetrahymena malaccensis]
MQTDDGFIEFQSYNDYQSLQAIFTKARDNNIDLTQQRSKEELIEDYFKYCVKVKNNQPMDVRAHMIKEHYFLVYARIITEDSQDHYPSRVYAVVLTDINNQISQIQPNYFSNDLMQAKVTPCFSLNQHLAQKLQSAQLSISKILLYLSDLQTISQKDTNQDTASIKSGSRRNSNDNIL